MFERSVYDEIQTITHSGIRIGGDVVIYMDPISINGAPHDADLILFTHMHFDHFSPRDVKKLLKSDTVIAADIRPNVFSRVMISMYSKAAVALAALILVEILLLRS